MPPRVDGQTEIIALLKKISEDNDKLHQEVASLRAENLEIQLKLPGLVNEAVQESLSQLEETISTQITDSAEEIMLRTSEISDALEHVEFIENSMSEHVSDELERMKSSLKASIYRKIVAQGKATRRYIASAPRALDASRSPRDSLQCQREFTSFPQLPPELRIKIWKMACFNDPRVVKLHLKNNWSTFNFYFSSYHLPAVLQTSRESRYEALKWYQSRCGPRKGDDHWLSPDRFKGTSIKYFNFEIDMLYLDIEETWSLHFPGTCWVEPVTKFYLLREFRRVVVSKLWAYSQWDMTAQFLSKPRSRIKEIVIVMDDDDLPETNQRLVPVNPDDSFLTINDDGPIIVRVGAEQERMWAILDDEDDDEDDGEILEDILEDDEEDTPVEAFSNAFEANREELDPFLVETRKPWPKLTYMAFKDVDPLPRARILPA